MPTRLLAPPYLFFLNIFSLKHFEMFTSFLNFLQHDAHPAASAPLPLFLNIFFFEHFKMFASFLTFLQHDAHPAAGANPVTRVSNRHAAV